VLGPGELIVGNKAILVLVFVVEDLVSNLLRLLVSQLFGGDLLREVFQDINRTEARIIE